MTLLIAVSECYQNWLTRVDDEKNREITCTSHVEILNDSSLVIEKTSRDKYWCNKFYHHDDPRD